MEAITVKSPILTDETSYSLAVIDATGQQVLQQPNTPQLNVANLPAGCIPSLVAAGDRVETGRFINQ